MKAWRQGGNPSRIQGALAILIAPLAISAYLYSLPGLNGFPYVLLPIASAMLAIYLYVKGQPNGGVFSLIALYLCGEIFTGTSLDIVYSTLYVNAIWMAFGCFILGVAAVHSGIVERLALHVIARTGSGYASLIVGLIVVGFLLSLIIPTAIARVLLILPILIALAGNLGFQAQSRGRTGLLFAGIIGTLVPSFAILPATVSSIVLQGSAEKLFSIEFSYSDYFIANFPALALPATIIATLLLIYLFREQPTVQAPPVPSAPVSSRGLVTLAIAAGAVLLWASDNFHNIPVTWIAIAAATLCLLPAIGPLRDVSVFQHFRGRTWVLLIGVLGAVTLFQMTGLNEAMSVSVVDWLDLSRGASGNNYAVLLLLSMALSILFTAQAAPAVFATLAKDMGLATGWPIEGVLLAQVAAWIFLIVPYMIPALWIGMRTCGLKYRDLISFVILYFLIGVSVILPLQFWWLHFLGYIP